ncbi:four-helix bundle copper-binding protein [Flavobacterium sp. I3-2]|nr:four-helix bundle copper-binding protein [Flavobacterium sp. I3-2]
MEICNACAEECEKHVAMGMEHCRECAEACRKCAQACEEMMAA